MGVILELRKTGDLGKIDIEKRFLAGQIANYLFSLISGAGLVATGTAGKMLVSALTLLPLKGYLTGRPTQLKLFF